MSYYVGRSNVPRSYWPAISCVAIFCALYLLKRDFLCASLLVDTISWEGVHLRFLLSCYQCNSHKTLPTICNLTFSLLSLSFDTFFRLIVSSLTFSAFLSLPYIPLSYYRLS